MGETARDADDRSRRDLAAGLSVASAGASRKPAYSGR